jgi:hypothetical protein
MSYIYTPWSVDGIVSIEGKFMSSEPDLATEGDGSRNQQKKTVHVVINL